jgi:hypothetical protein
LEKATERGKKYKVILNVDGQEQTVSFGAKGMSDYTKNKDEKRKENYLTRHREREDWSKRGLLTAGFWAKHLLWGDTTSLEKNLELTKKRFNL